MIYIDRNQFDRKQFDDAWLMLRPTLLQYAACLNANDAEDLTQETYLLAVALLNHYDPTTGCPGLRQWLRAILVNIHRNMQRQIERRREDQLSRDARQQPIPDPEPEDDEQEAYERLIVDYQIHCLSRRRSEVWHYYRQGLKQSAIAAALGITQPTVSYHIGIIIQEMHKSAGNLISRTEDGYANAEALFRAMSRAYIYRAPKRKGDTHKAPRLRRLK